MPVCGLKLTLSNEPDVRRQARDELAMDRRLTLGQVRGRFLPVAAETSSHVEERGLLDELRYLRGVDHVDVVFVEVRAGCVPSKLNRHRNSKRPGVSE